MFEQVWSWLEGRKTYLAAAGFLITALVFALEKDYPRASEAFMAALAAFGLRQALAKTIAAPSDKM